MGVQLARTFMLFWNAMERSGCCRDIEFKNFGLNTNSMEPILG
jgi:hypothetical protein